MLPACAGRLTDPPASFLLVGVRIVDPSDGTDAVGDLAVTDGRIVTSGEVPPAAERIDGPGMIATPGFCDLHVHLRDPGDPVSNNVCRLNPRLFHRYILEWQPGVITIKYDSRTCLVHRIDPAEPLTGSAPFDRPFHLILTQTLGTGQNPFDPATTCATSTGTSRRG